MRPAGNRRGGLSGEKQSRRSVTSGSAEGQGVVGHGIDDGKGLQVDAALSQRSTALLEALLDDDADTGAGCSGLVDEVQEALHGAAVCKKIVNDENPVAGPEIFLRDDDIVGPAVCVGRDLCGIETPVEVGALRFLGEDNRNMEVLGRDAGDADAGGLDGENSGDVLLPEQAVEFLSDFVQKVNVHLVIEKAVNFENIAWADGSVAENAFL